jgi:hypothetical protein
MSNETKDWSPAMLEFLKDYTERLQQAIQAKNSKRS